MPKSGIDCELISALSVTTRVAVREPFALGLKVTLMEQVALGLKVLPVQLSVSEKSPASAPEIATLVIERDVPPALVKVMDLWAAGVGFLRTEVQAGWAEAAQDR